MGTVVTLRGKYRCSRCGEVCGELEDWQVDGEQVVCFTGKEFAWSAFRRQVVGFTVRTLLTPDYGSPPMTMCPTHGPLDVTAEGLRRDAVRSVDVELGQARGKATRNVKIAPLHAEWDGVPERSQ